MSERRGRGAAWWWWIAIAVVVVLVLAGGAVVVVTDKQLRAILRTLPTKRVGDIPYLNAAMREFSITTPARIAAFLAQVGHESGDFRYFEELGSGAAYDVGSLAIRLGNTPEDDDDGELYKGRGAIQLTGKKNYKAAGDALGVDLLAHPELAAQPQYAYRIAAWYWATHGLNELADVGNFDAITLRINGGYNGKDDRDARYARARSALGLEAAA